MTKPLGPPYKNPPIEEALVEFRFEPSQEWDLTIPGKMHQHDKIKGAYPGKPQQQMIFQQGLVGPPGGPAAVAVQEGVGRIQLADQDRRRLLVLGPDVVSVNVVRPYDGWDAFRPRIEAALGAYQEVAAPKAVKRIGVRYINKIVVPRTGVELEVYFRCGFVAPDGLPQRLGGFLDRAEYLYEDGAKLIFNYASLKSATEETPFLLDLDVVSNTDKPIPIDGAMTLVDELHKREGIAFEALITDETRRLFDGP